MFGHIIKMKKVEGGLGDLIDEMIHIGVCLPDSIYSNERPMTSRKRRYEHLKSELNRRGYELDGTAKKYED